MTADYDIEEEIRRMVVDQLTEDFAESREQFTKALCAMVGLRRLKDLPPRERWERYMVNPPLDVTGLPPPDRPGVFPMWQAMSMEVQDAYLDYVKDYMDLRDRMERGEMNGGY